MKNETQTTAQKTYAKLSAELAPVYEKAQIAVMDIVEAQEAAEGISGQIGTLCDKLFAEVRGIQLNKGKSASEIFNVLAYLAGYDYIAAADGTPDINGKKNSKGAPWPKGTLSTYRAQCQKVERPKNQGGLGRKVSDYPTFKELRAEANPRVEKSDFEKAMAEFKAAKLTTANRGKIEKAILATLKAQLIELAKAARPEAVTAAAPKSHAKKKAA